MKGLRFHGCKPFSVVWDFCVNPLCAGSPAAHSTPTGGLAIMPRLCVFDPTSASLAGPAGLLQGWRCAVRLRLLSSRAFLVHINLKVMSPQRIRYGQHNSIGHIGG